MAVSNPVPRLQAINVSKIYRSRRVSNTEALRDISLDVSENELVCLLGESGCGKSTLLHMLAGLEPPTSGSLHMDGVPISGPSRDRTIVFQQPGLLPWLTVRGNIELGVRIQHRRASQAAMVDKLVELMGLGGFQRHRAWELSGGMAQRAALARAMACEPRVLFLDEPFGALDTFTRIRLQHEFAATWEATRCTTVLVTHDIEEAVFLASRIVIMSPRPGRIARMFNNGLRRPRDRNGPEFFRMRQMISKEFAILALEHRESAPREVAGSPVKE